jgi:uncharacterized protein (DUF697 family)/tellurite resistance protein
LTEPGFPFNSLATMDQKLTTPQQEALLTICLMAAFADGDKDDTERELIKKMAASVLDEGLDAPAIYQNVIFQRIALGSAAAPLAGGPAARLAYEMAVGVCEADDVLTPPEKDFLVQLRSHLGLDARTAETVEAEAEELAIAPVPEAGLVAAAVPAALTGGEPDPATASMILNYAILNGALELLPESLATMAVIPLQVKMVYRIGRSHGVELDRGHIKEFAAAAGIGLTSQVVEGFARKLIKGVLGKRGLVARTADQLTSSTFAFASTYALGYAADAYYRGGRSMSTVQLKELFDSVSARGKQLFDQYLPAIKEKASGLDMSKVLAEVRSSGAPGAP